MQIHVKAILHIMPWPSFARRANTLAMRIRLAEFRNASGLTLEAMSERVDASVSQLSRWEKGKSNIPSGRLPELARAYGCTVSEIFAEDGAAEAAADAPALTKDALEAMLAIALDELPADTPRADWPRIVASNLHAQLARIEASGGLRPNEARAPEATPARGKAARSPAPTRPAARE